MNLVEATFWIAVSITAAGLLVLHIWGDRR